MIEGGVVEGDTELSVALFGDVPRGRGATAVLLSGSSELVQIKDLME